MNPTEFRKSIDRLYERLVALTRTKGQEYKGRDASQFANFERHAAAMGMIREQVLFVYLMKHMDSITTFIKDRAAGQHHQYAEPVTGRIDDAILYLLLLRGMVEDGEGFLMTTGGSPLAAEPEVPTLCPPSIVPSRTPEERAADEARPRHEWEQVSPAFDEAIRVPMSELEPLLTPVTQVCVSRVMADSVKWCQDHGIPAASCALSTPDQLYGIKSPGRVTMLHHGTVLDDHLAREIEDRCKRQGLLFEMEAL